MTQDRLVDYVWGQLGPRKHLAGRERVAELVAMSVSTFPAEALGQCNNDRDLQTVTDATASSLRRRLRQREYGVFWTLILTSLASAVIQVLVKWWLENRLNRVMMLVMRQEATP